MKWKTLLMLTGMILFLYACGSIVNPYSSEFACPQAEKGKCVGIPQAYEEVIKAEEAKKKKKSNDSVTVNGTEELNFSLFEKELEEELAYEKLLLKKYHLEKLSGILRDPQTPILVSPKVIRILILPYAQGKNLYMGRYVYTILEEPRWVLENLILEGWEKE